MPGPAPKHPSARTRRNKTTTAATLRADAAIVAPELPGDDWHSMTLGWWRDLWASPMAPEYDESDRHGLFRVAMLVNDFWSAPDARERAAAQLRLEKAEADYGTNPMARRRLQWEIERTEEAQTRGMQRRERSAPKSDKGDPRATLRAV